MIISPFDCSTAAPLKFRENGNFRILHITDTHLDFKNTAQTVFLIEQACDTENPDLVVLTGDNAMSSNIVELKYRINALMQIFDCRHIPVAVCFGNHETESGVVSRQELMKIYNSYSCSISVDEGSFLPGCGTYHIPVFSSKDHSLKFNIWLFDTHGDDGEGHYSNVSRKQVEWYEKKSNILTAYNNNKKVYSLAFQHTIVPEVYSALKKVRHHLPYTYKHLYRDEYYAFEPKNINFGLLHETPCCGYYNNGQFDAMVNKGDVLAVFSGHDHTNAFGVRYKGIDIVNSLSTRYNGDRFSTQYGYRVIDINENNANKYTTRVVHWFDKYNLFNMYTFKSKGQTAYRTAKTIAMNAVPEKLIETVGHNIVRLFGRKVKYPD